MFKRTDEVLNIKSVPSNISYKSFKTYNLLMPNSYCDDRNFERVNRILVGSVHDCFVASIDLIWTRF